MILETGEQCILRRGCEQKNMNGETAKSDLKGAVRRETEVGEGSSRLATWRRVTEMVTQTD